VTVYEAGHLGDSGHILGYREICAHGGFSSQNSIDAHFGVPGAPTADIRIVWPGSGSANVVQDAQGVITGQRLTIHESDIAGVGQTLEAFEVIVSESAPNPFLGTTRIALEVPSETKVAARVFDVNGRLVAPVISGRTAAGRHIVEWSGSDADGNRLPPGIFFWRIETKDQVATRKVVMVR
jgi:hypothetical protein